MVFRPNELHPTRSNRDLYGWEMRAHRKRAGDMSLDQLTNVLDGFSKSHLARVERAASMPCARLSQALDAAFGTDGTFGRLYELAKREKFPGKYRRAMDLEGRAGIIEEYTSATIPGLLQTPGLARRSLEAGHPHASAQEIDGMLSARLDRQKRLDSAPAPRCWFILDEAVLRRPVGGSEVMRAQLAALLDDRRSHVTLQVLPFGAGEHAEMGGSLTLYTVPGNPLIAWVEGSHSGVIIEDPEGVAARRESYDLLRAKALSPRDSSAMIRTVMEEC
ncbi:DUF5753 domain-containing protein [Kitasatospora sp. NPDC057015]|uniref:DUF5753 domain-containing protein n=1 Tax=Kitasatospora sp. NPDC057015 TaxID=3346001 RepID=UPI00362954C2